MIPENLLVEMGKAVARDILDSDDKFRELEKELEEIQNKWESKANENEISNTYPNIKAILNVILRQQKPPGLKVVVGASTSIYWNGERKNLRSFERELSKERDIKNLTKLYLKEILFRPGEKKKLCTICNNHNGSEKRVLSLLKQANTSTYKKEEGQIDCICSVCNFWIFLSNYYPLPVNTYRKLPNTDIYYFYVSNLRNLIYPTLFYGNFLRYLKHKSIVERDNERVFLVFYTEGDQSKNNPIISYGEFNMLNSLKKMIKDNKLKSANNFQRIFLFSNIVNNKYYISSYLPFFVEMIQNDMIPTELMRHFLRVFRDRYKGNPNNYSGELNSFKTFIQDYFEVKNMSNDKTALDRGWNMGKKLIDEVKENKDNFQRWVIALSGMMEMSEKEFMRGILQIQRRVRTNIYTKDLEEIAKNSRARAEFLVGLLSGVTTDKSEKTDTQEEFNVQQGDKNE